MMNASTHNHLHGSGTHAGNKGQLDRRPFGIDQVAGQAKLVARMMCALGAVTSNSEVKMLDAGVFSKKKISVKLVIVFMLSLFPFCKASAVGVINVADYGALCNDSNDDTADINNALAAFRTALASNSASLIFPGGTCKVTGTLNFTSIRSMGAMINGSGTTIDAQMSGMPVIDAFNTRWLRLYNLTIQTSNDVSPTIGLQMGLISTASGSDSDDNMLHDVFINGNFTVAALYNRSSETSIFEHVFAWNSSSSGIGMILDGYNHFNPPSSFVTVTLPTDEPNSFNEDLFLNCDFRESGGGGGVWMGQISRHKFVSSYIGNTGGSSSAVTMYFESSGGSVNMLDFDVHIETPSVTDEFFLSGTASSASIDGLQVRDHNPQESNSIFKVDSRSTISSASLSNASLELGVFSGGALKVFDNASLWTMSGSYNLAPGVTQWNLPIGSFQGSGMTGASASYTGNTASSLFPSTLSIAQLSNTGSVSSVSSVSGCYYIPGGGSVFPSLTIARPPGGGAQASAVVSGAGLSCPAPGSNIVAGGTSYVVGDILSLAGGMCSSIPAIVVTAVSSGAVTAFGGSNAGLCGSLPVEPVSWTGGHGSGLQTRNHGWQPLTTTVTIPGGGYSTAPSVQANPIPGVTVCCGSSGTASTTISANLVIKAGNSALTLANGLTSLGGHIGSVGSAPTLSSCGTSPSLDAGATDFDGTIILGTGGIVACSLSFSSSFNNPPRCVVTANTGSAFPYISSRSNSSLTIGLSSTLSAGQVTYHCIQ